MALLDNAFYVDYGNGSSTGYYAVTAWATGAAKTAGAIIRQATVSPALTERCFVCYNSTGGTGTTGASEPTWSTPTRGEQYTDNSVKWEECTGVAALNGDITNTPTWTAYRTATATATLGQVIQNVAGTLLLLCTVGGTMAALGSEPSWSAYTTTGATTADGTGATWVTLGATNKYSIWHAPQARLANAFTSTWGAAGNAFFVSSIHAETQASAITLTSPAANGTAPCFVYGVKNAPATTPPGSADLSTGATISTTGNSNFTAIQQHVYFYGIQFSCGTGNNAVTLGISNSSSDTAMIFDTCVMQIAATSASALMLIGADSSNAHEVIFNNTTVEFGATGQSIRLLNGYFNWQNTASAISGSGSTPTVLFNASNAGLSTALIDGVDLSAVSGTLVQAGSIPYQVYFRDCKLNSSVTVAGTPTSNRGGITDLIVSDSAGTNYQQQRYRYEGTLTTRTDIIRTGGAQVTGTGVAWSIATTANAKFLYPFQAFTAAIQNSTTNSGVTVTMYGIWETAALPNNDQIWLECEYLGASGNPLGSFANNTKASNLATGTALTADSTSAWGAGQSAWQATHAYGAFTGVILAGNASPQQLWFMASHSGTGTSGSSSTIFNGQADGAQVTDNSGSNQIVWQALTRFSMSVTFTPQQAGQINCKVKAGAASKTFYVDPQPVL